MLLKLAYIKPIFIFVNFAAIGELQPGIPKDPRRRPCRIQTTITCRLHFAILSHLPHRLLPDSFFFWPSFLSLSHPLLLSSNGAADSPTPPPVGLRRDPTSSLAWKPRPSPRFRATPRLPPLIASILVGVFRLRSRTISTGSSIADQIWSPRSIALLLLWNFTFT